MSLSDALSASFSRAQRESLFECEGHAIALWSGAVSAGKTFTSLWAFLQAIPTAPTGLIVVIGRSLQTVYQNLFTLLQDPLIFGPIASEVKYTAGATKAQILGREVMIVGANNAASVGRIQGATVALAYVDEAALLPEEFWNMLVTRGRANDARILATMNPASMNHWMRKEWILKARDKDVVHFHHTMEDNPTLKDEYKARMRASYSGVFYDRMILGKWTNAEGAIYPMWDPQKHQVKFEDMPRVHRVIGVGIDFGTSNATAGIMLGVTDDRRLVAMDEFLYHADESLGKPRLAPSKQAKMYVSWLSEKHHPIQQTRPDQWGPGVQTLPEIEYHVVDPAAAHFREELFNLDINAWAGNNDVSAGIGTVSRLLDSGKLIVSDRCSNLLSEITEYRWDAKATEKGQDAPVKENDHSCDALRYVTHTLRSQYSYELTA
ncbi:PBSX family phage terminase large subunit [Gryllotalpicola koreensis]|uniref:PBSX family phage terminase large subunit n=1 Tax=Gryllotalpicola koreensis TaxID=993086 RepID=A0ABP8A1R4_9MICO